MSQSSETAAFPIVVLISGSGSNLQSIIDRQQDFESGAYISMVISNNPEAHGLQRARKSGISTIVINHRDYPDRPSYDAALMVEIDRYQPKLVVLAGFMRLLTTDFVSHYSGRLINIHPSLLPRYPGLNTHQRAIENGDRKAGATVHYVTAEVDGGPIIIQASVPVAADDNSQQLAQRVLAQEHHIYPRAIQWFTQGRLTVKDNKVLLDGDESAQQRIISNEI